MDLEEEYEREVFQTAVHESGHVLVAWRLGLDVEMAGLSLDGETAGRTLIIPDKKLKDSDSVYTILENCRSVEKRIRISFGGPIAEGKFAGDTVNLAAAQNDFERAVILLRGLADTQDEREVIGNYLHSKTRRMVERNWKQIMQLATELTTHGEICSEQIESVLGPRRIEFECAARFAS